MSELLPYENGIVITCCYRFCSSICTYVDSRNGTEYRSSSFLPFVFSRFETAFSLISEEITVGLLIYAFTEFFFLPIGRKETIIM